jgi:hypothetical protein
MKLLVMMNLWFKDYVKFKESLDNLDPSISELVYFKNRQQNSYMCDKYSLEEFEMPCVQISRAGESLGSVHTESLLEGIKYANAIIWFDLNSGVTDSTISRAMARANKRVFFIKIR